MIIAGLIILAAIGWTIYSNNKESKELQEYLSSDEYKEFVKSIEEDEYQDFKAKMDRYNKEAK